MSSLDASVRGEILALLLGCATSSGLTVLVVTHDLGLAWNIADRIAVMYLGRIVEIGPTEEVLARPAAPVHAGAAVGACPEIEHVEPVVLTGEPPDPTRIPAGCRFHPRCPELASGAAARGRRSSRPAGRGSLPILPGHRRTSRRLLPNGPLIVTILTDARVSKDRDPAGTRREEST